MARSGWPPCLAAHRDAVPRPDAIGFPTALCQRGGLHLSWLAPDDTAPQITRALNHDVTTSVTITTAKITARIRPTWSQ